MSFLFGLGAVALMPVFPQVRSGSPTSSILGKKILNECTRANREPSLAIQSDEQNAVAESRCSLKIIKAELGGQTQLSEINSSERSLAVIEDLQKFVADEMRKTEPATASVDLILDLQRCLRSPLPSMQNKTLDRYGIEKLQELRKRHDEDHPVYSK